MISCGRPDYKILPFEGKNVYAECEINGKFTVIIKKEDFTCGMEIVSPSEISEIEFTFSETGDYVKSGDITMPLDRNLLSGIYALSSLFDIKEEAMISAVSKEGKGFIEFQNEAGAYTLIFDANGYITDAEISGDDFDYKVKILSIKIIDKP